MARAAYTHKRQHVVTKYLYPTGASLKQIDWRARAVCARHPEHPPSLWDATPGEYNTPRVQKAKAICNTQCPVKDSCLKWALDTQEPNGILGGMRPKDRAIELELLRAIYGQQYPNPA